MCFVLEPNLNSFRDFRREHVEVLLYHSDAIEPLTINPLGVETIISPAKELCPAKVMKYPLLLLKHLYTCYITTLQYDTLNEHQN
jgi:hypothetical protein